MLLWVSDEEDSGTFFTHLLTCAPVFLLYLVTPALTELAENDQQVKVRRYEEPIAAAEGEQN